MDGLCLLHNERTCAKKEEIRRAKTSRTVRVMDAYEWGSASDNEALIYEEVHGVFSTLQCRFPQLEFSFEGLGGKGGSIYCDICAQIRLADVAIFCLFRSIRPRVPAEIVQ